MALSLYNEKRNFKVTPEPEGKVLKKNAGRFVVQRHEATRLHYDFRLELDGVLKSWAVPKGPSLNPADKRLAMMVEDHPVSYIGFEGRIPAGNYGAGTVNIWDEGKYIPVNEKHEKITEKQALQNLENGQLKFALEGKKLNGEFVLVRLKNDNKKNNSWLLIKHRDQFAADRYDSEEHLSPASARKAAAKKAPSKKASAKSPEPITTTTPKKYSDYFKPMLASLADDPFDSKDWVFEIKWDGYRAVAEWDLKELKFYSRNGLSFISKYPSIAAELRKLKKKMVLDGEVVMMNEDHQPDFQKLQQYEDNKHLPLHYYVFDLLFLDGKDVRDLPLLERKTLLKKALGKNNVIRYCDHYEENGRDFFEQAVETNLEGIIAKRTDSRYVCGIRTKEWLKIKHQHIREAIIAGYTDPRGSRKHFGALILAEYEGKALKYLGHTGTGFTERSLKELWKQMQPLVMDASPFKEKIKVNAPVTWLKPKLVCQLHYTEVTEGGMLRHPVFLGLRQDKSVNEVQRINETPIKPAPAPEVKKTSKVAKRNKKQADQVVTVKGNKKVVLDKREVTITNADKLYFPEDQITKGELAAYYEAIAPYILPYLKDRPLSLKRNPNGIHDKGFFHKDAGGDAPAWIKKAEIYSESANKTINYLICNDAASLIYIVNLGCIEMNPWNSRTNKLDHPDYMVIDIDPSDKNSFEEVITTAKQVKSVLDDIGAEGYCKTSGSTGLHIYIPLGAKYSYDECKEFGKLVAARVLKALPDITSMERSLQKRGDKIYIDYLQNRKGQTLASAYSVRPKPGAPVSTPLEWSEVKKGLHPSQFTIHNIAERLQKKGDLFKPVLGKGISLEKAIKKLS